MLCPQYLYNIFTKNHTLVVIIGSNLNLVLEFFFFFLLPITTHNNLPLKIYCKNIVDIAFLFLNTIIHTIPPVISFSRRLFFQRNCIYAILLCLFTTLSSSLSFPYFFLTSITFFHLHFKPNGILVSRFGYNSQ